LPEKNKFDEPYISLRGSLVKVPEVPAVEWWDQFFLPNETMTRFNPGPITEKDIFMDRLTHFVQHPVPLVNERVKADEKMTVPFVLTAAEKKKLRRKKRLQKEKDKQEKVQLGLAPAPLPRVTMSNFMKVMAKEAVQDPTACERKVQQIVTSRVNAHLQRNESGKLNKDQREAKMKRKHDRDTANECQLCVFRVSNVALQSQLRFKVDMNAQ
jgi:U4/U6 small nuclear ribonucleoprotein PRP3